MVASQNEFGSSPFSEIFWKTLRISVSSSLNFWPNSPVIASIFQPPKYLNVAHCCAVPSGKTWEAQSLRIKSHATESWSLHQSYLHLCSLFSQVKDCPQRFSPWSHINSYQKDILRFPVILEFYPVLSKGIQPVWHEKTVKVCLKMHIWIQVKSFKMKQKWQSCYLCSHWHRDWALESEEPRFESWYWPFLDRLINCFFKPFNTVPNIQ